MASYLGVNFLATIVGQENDKAFWWNLGAKVIGTSFGLGWNGMNFNEVKELCYIFRVTIGEVGTLIG